MAAAVDSSGSQTATIGTEHTLATITTAGTYAPVLDLSGLAAGDVLEVRVYGKLASSGDTERLCYVGTFAQAQATPLAIGPPMLVPISFRLTIKQTAGTGRAVPWAVWKP